MFQYLVTAKAHMQAVASCIVAATTRMADVTAHMHPFDPAATIHEKGEPFSNATKNSHTNPET